MKWLSFLVVTVLLAQEAPKFPLPPKEAPEPPVEFVCPMDPDVRALKPGKCSRCGMALVPGIPDQVEYPVDLNVSPRAAKAGEKLELAFAIRDPKTGKQITDFEIVHERLFHMFIVSQDLQYFVHDHPVKGADSVFRYQAQLPQPGMYRVAERFLSEGRDPAVDREDSDSAGSADYSGHAAARRPHAEAGRNLTATLTMEPREPIAGMKTLMFFKLEPGDGMEQYLGAWGHMMAASDDLVDMIHTHPFLADGGPNVQFNMIFPRPGVYRVWVQFQRKGVVNTVAFNVPVSELK